MTAADFDLTTILFALRERAAEQSRDGPAGAAANQIALIAYSWLGDNIGAFVSDLTSESLPDAVLAPEAESPSMQEKDWRDDPSADQRWNAGVDFAQQKLCKVLGVNPVEVHWDAATETVDGDIEAVTANILTLAMGERWRSKKIDTKRRHVTTLESVREDYARRYVLHLLKDGDTNRVFVSVVISLLRRDGLVPAGESGFELLDRMKAAGLVDTTGMTLELTQEGFRIAESVRPA